MAKLILSPDNKPSCKIADSQLKALRFLRVGAGGGVVLVQMDGNTLVAKLPAVQQTTKTFTISCSRHMQSSRLKRARQFYTNGCLANYCKTFHALIGGSWVPNRRYFQHGSG